MVDRTQGQGKGVKEFGGRVSKLKKLHPRTVKRRKRFKGLSGSTSPNTSNLTMTGKMLASLGFILKGRSSLLIRIKGSRNKKVAQHVQNDRPFMNLSKSEIVSLVKFFKRIIRSR